MQVIRQLIQTIQSTRFSVGITDILEMILIAYLIYRLLVWVKNTRTWFLIKGLAVIAGFYAISWLLSFNAILYIISRALDVLLIAIVVVFQPEIRKALERLGNGSLLNIFKNSALSSNYGIDTQAVKELVDAAEEMAKARTGALIVIEKDMPLGDYINTGIKVDGELTSQLLLNIFEHNTPLHDGAVILRGNRIMAATCYLPLSSNPNISKAFGTRHRAAVGISEISDSITIVVSEETGRISLAENGHLKENVGREALFEVLSSLYTVEKKSRWKLRLRRKKHEEAAS